MNIKKMAGTALLAGAMGAAGLGLGAGAAQADDHWVPWWPDVPGQGPTGWGAPGQLKKICDPPFFPACGTPPGHWIAGPQGPPIPAPWR